MGSRHGTGQRLSWDALTRVTTVDRALTEAVIDIFQLVIFDGEDDNIMNDEKELKYD